MFAAKGESGVHNGFNTLRQNNAADILHKKRLFTYNRNPVGHNNIRFAPDILGEHAVFNNKSDRFVQNFFSFPVAGLLSYG